MSRYRDDTPPMRVALPADIERPDNLIGSFTARQIVILGGTGLLLWLAWAASRELVAAQTFLAAAAPVALAGFLLAVGRRDGISLDRWVLAAIAHRRSPRRLVPADGPIPPTPAWITASGKMAPPAPLRLPAKGIEAGVIDLGPDGNAALIACSTVNLHLRTPAEQNALVAGYARWLNSIDAPVQILVRSQRVDLAPMAHTITEHAGVLADPDLEAAARRHAAFLHELSATRELLHRQVSVVVRDKRSRVHAQHRAAEAARALAACDIHAHVLDTPQVATLVADCAGAPAATSYRTPDQVIHGRASNPS